MKRQQRFIEGVIFRARRGCEYPGAQKGFNCYTPAHTGDFHTCDCWVTNELGDIDPGFNVSPVPVCSLSLGQAIGRLPCPHCGKEE